MIESICKLFCWTPYSQSNQKLLQGHLSPAELLLLAPKP